jgi:hypothetical protein
VAAAFIIKTISLDKTLRLTLAMAGWIRNPALVDGKCC